LKVSKQANTAAALAGWKGTVFVPSGSTVRLLVRFPGYSDPAPPSMFRCHLLQHEDEHRRAPWSARQGRRRRL
jgi:FtsP/CotA-like multicopper oxidase with cupredoxin domain